jgi:hypothetical protein
MQTQSFICLITAPWLVQRGRDCCDWCWHSHLGYLSGSSTLWAARRQLSCCPPDVMTSVPNKGFLSSGPAHLCWAGNEKKQWWQAGSPPGNRAAVKLASWVTQGKLAWEGGVAGESCDTQGLSSSGVQRAITLGALNSGKTPPASGTVTQGPSPCAALAVKGLGPKPHVATLAVKGPRLTALPTVFHSATCKYLQGPRITGGSYSSLTCDFYVDRAKERQPASV